MKIVVTGGCGFIGSAFIRMAIKRGYEIVNIDKLTYAANPKNLASIANHTSYHFENIDICNSAAIRACLTQHQPDYILHLAAESHVDRSIDGPDDFIQTNIVGTFTLLQEALGYWTTLNDERKLAFRFHHVSTDEVYGDLSLDDPAFEETTPYDPSSPYSASKAASDHLVRAWHRTYGLPVLLTNCSNNYGPYQFPEKLIPVVVLKALHGEPIPIYGKGDNVRDWLYVDDHAGALLTVLQNGKVGETYNIGGNNEWSNLDLVKAICGIIDDSGQGPNTLAADLIEFVTDRPGHDRRYAINTYKINKELGWEPSFSAKDGLRNTVKWYLENEDWWRPLLKRHSVGTRLGVKTTSTK